MPEEKTQAELEKEAQEREAQEKLDKEAAEKKAAEEKKVKIENGQVTLSERDYNNLAQMKEDMLTYKEKMRASELKLETLISEKLKAEEEQLKKDKKFEELYEKEKQEKVDMQVKVNEQEITSELKVKALELGIVKAEYIKLIDRAAIKKNEDTGELSGIDEAVKSFKEKNPSLFSIGGTTPVDTSQGGPAGPVTDDDVRKMTAAQVMKAKADDPALYKRWSSLATHGKTLPERKPKE